jgi:hypothetical protein
VFPAMFRGAQMLDLCKLAGLFPPPSELIDKEPARQKTAPSRRKLFLVFAVLGSPGSLLLRPNLPSCPGPKVGAAS